MNEIKFILACSLLAPLISATTIYRRPILYSKLDAKSDALLSPKAQPSDPSSTVKKGNNHENAAENNVQPQKQPHNVLIPGPPGVPLYSPFYLVPLRDEHEQSHGGQNGGGFGAFGTLAIPGLHVNLGGGQGFGGSLQASGGFSGGHGQHGHYGGIGVVHAIPVHYGGPYHYGYQRPHYGGYGGYGGGGVGGFAIAGAAAGATPWYAGEHGIHHKTETIASGAVNLNPTGPILGVPQKGNELAKQPEFVVEVSPYHEGGAIEQSVLPPGYHYPGFIASSAGRLGYPVLMASPEQLQDIQLRQNPNPLVQFFQRPFQFFQMFLRPNQGNSSKQPEKPAAEKPVVESPSGAKPAEKPVEAKPNKEKPTVSQNNAPEKPSVNHDHAHAASVNKVNEAKQNVTATANHPKKPAGSAASATSGDKKDKPKDRPKPAAGVSDVIASVNEVVKATSAVQAGSGPSLPVFVDEANSLARVGDDVKPADEANSLARVGDDAKAVEEEPAVEATDTDENVVPNEESAIDIESKPVE